MLTMAALAVLGIPLWMIVAALALSYWSRRRFKAGTGVFPCRVRDIPDSGERHPGAVRPPMDDGSTTSCRCIRA